MKSSVGRNQAPEADRSPLPSVWGLSPTARLDGRLRRCVTILEQAWRLESSAVGAPFAVGTYAVPDVARGILDGYGLQAAYELRC